MAAYEVLLLNTAIPQIQAAQSGDTYVVPRDIAFSAALTLSAGTANGVPYLNASKVLTTGSALTFDGSNLGLGQVPAVRKFEINAIPASISQLNGIRMQMDGVATSASEFLLGTDSGGVPYTSIRTGNDGNSYMNFLVGSGPTERMRISSDGTFRVKGAGTAGSTDAVQFSGSAPASAMTLDASGNLLVGGTTNTSMATVQITVGSTSTASSALQLLSTTSGSNGIYFGDGTSSTDRYRGYLEYNHASDFMVFATAATERARISSDGTFRVKGAGTAGTTDAFQVAGTAPADAARIDSSGNLLVGTTSTSNGALINWYKASGTIETSSGGITTAQNHIVFANPNGNVGSIQVDGSATSYNTSSDYRLKNTIAPMTGALAKVALLKPCTYKWNVDGSDGEGFIAHELAEVCPSAVVGEKDAVDADGKPQYQGIDTSFLVATLTAAIQELKAEFDAYKATHP